MHRPTLLEGVLVALVLSLSLSPLIVLVQLSINLLVDIALALLNPRLRVT